MTEPASSTVAKPMAQPSARGPARHIAVRIRSAPLTRALAALQPDRSRFALAVAAGTGALGCAIALLGVSGWLITRASQQPPVLYLMVAVVTVRALGLGRGLLRYAERLLGHDVALRGAVALRVSLFEQLGRAPSSVAAGYRRGDLLARLGSDVDMLADLIVRALLPVAVALVTGIAAVAVLVVLLPLAGGILAVGLLVAGVCASLLSARAVVGAEQGAADARAVLAADTLDLMENLPELTVAGAVPGRLDRQAGVERTLASELDAASRPAAAGALVATLGTGGAVLGCLAAGVAATSSGLLDPVLLAVVVLVALGTGEAVAPLPAAAVALVRGRHAAARICELLDAAGEVSVTGRCVPQTGARTRWADHPHLRAESVLRGVDLDLPCGRRLAVVGHSGAGKTTLMRTLAGLQPTAGRVTLAVDGQPPRDISTYGDEEVRAAVTFVADDAHVFATTMRENLRLADPRADDAVLVAALRRVGLGPWLDGHPAGLDTRLTADGAARDDGCSGALSGGERRRLLLARAVLARSGVLLLDEPAEHLDPETADELVASALTRGDDGLAGDRSVVVVTHRLAPLWLADEVVVLNHGRVAARGTHAQLLAQYQPYRHGFEHETADATAVA